MELKQKNIKRQNLFQLGLSLLIVILINIIGSFLFTRIDLTSEKRYSLSPATKKILKNLDDLVYFKVYLDGDFPAGFKRLRNETKEMLDEFRAYSNNIQYEFINPSENENKKALSDSYKLLMEKGIQPTYLQSNNTSGSSSQIIFPAALVTYRNKEIPLQLLMTKFGASAEGQLNNSIQALEYNLSNTIHKLTGVSKPKVAFIEGHGELDKYSVADAMFSIGEFYEVERIAIDEQINKLRIVMDTASGSISNRYELLIIAKPDSVFSEKDKFIIDQHIMHGGKVLWLVDPVFASQDSLQKSDYTLGITQNLNLEDMFFKYGVRLNTNLIMDLNALPIPVKTGEIGGQPQFSFLPWFYFPLINPISKHPIVNNLNALKTEFVSSLDTIGLKNIKKTILLTSSQYSRTVNAPVRISLEILRKEPEQSLYNNKYLPIAVLLEGKFSSLYKNRLAPEFLSQKSFSFKDESDNTAMIVIADGDMIKNQTRVTNGMTVPLPLGYDRYTNETFGNKDFILNAINYLCDDSGLMSLRTREVKLRMMDKQKIQNNKIAIQIVNSVIPVVIILLTGLILYYRRKKINSSI